MHTPTIDATAYQPSQIRLRVCSTKGEVNKRWTELYTIGLERKPMRLRPSREDARQMSENITGFFSVLAEWSRAELPAPANDNAGAATSDDERGRHDR
jgi:hypothetical protein